MTQEELRIELGKYDYWLTKSAREIINDVKKVDGWVNVFPKGVKQWAHKLRNYFNEEPMALTRLSEREAAKYYSQVLGMVIINGRARSFGAFPNKDNIVLSRTLTGDVYRDQNNKIWFQMTPGGTIYHWGEPVKREFGEAVYTSYIRGQALTPVFKLVSLDETGGSQETIIKNPQNKSIGIGNVKIGQPHIGKVGKPKPVSAHTELDPKYDGSYNYSETVEKGISAHKKRDVDPHHNDPIYLNPPNRFVSLELRRFPKLSNLQALDHLI